MAKRAALTSLALSALTWLGVLINYIAVATWPRDAAILVVAFCATVSGLVTVFGRRRSMLSWSSLAVSLVFPIWLWHILSGLSGDAF